MVLFIKFSLPFPWSFFYLGVSLVISPAAGMQGGRARQPGASVEEGSAGFLPYLVTSGTIPTRLPLLITPSPPENLRPTASFRAFFMEI